MASLLLGCIADDFTGATDLANNLARAGMCVVLTIGVPEEPLGVHADAVVIALKSRTISPKEAVAQALAALRWLQAQRVSQVYFKYCSTFDSKFAGEERGNIGPVTEALMDALDCDFTIACPAFPDNQRAVFKGYLFVGDVLLSESSMKDHPLTPMTDANVVRVLQAQCTRKVGLVDQAVVARGRTAVGERIAELRTHGVAIAVIDAVSNEDLLRLGPCLADLQLLTGGSGLATGLPGNFNLSLSSVANTLPPPQGARAVVAGSCSQATNRQVQDFISRGGAALALDPLRIANGGNAVDEVLAWARQRISDGPLLVYSTAEPGAVRSVQEQLGVEEGGAMVERTMAGIARGLVELGVGQLVVAGGETSGACVQALGTAQMRIGPQIAPGVPWCYVESTAARGGLHLALKSGNFGDDDFFTHAFRVLA